MLSILLMVKYGSYKVHVWYFESSTPDVDQYNGCSDGSMARLKHIGIVDP